MGNLIAVQRWDLTGKLVTRHVRADPIPPSKRPALPAPALVPSGFKSASQKPSKLRPKQLQVMPRMFEAESLHTDNEVCSTDERNALCSDGVNYRFEASSSEIYNVFSTVEESGNAIVMLADGVRSVEGAHEWLTARGAEHLIIDRSELMQEALEKNLDAEDFVKYGHHPNRWGHKIDAALFSATALNKGDNGSAVRDIVTGAISYDDIKKLGITKLKQHNRLHSMNDILKQVNRGEATIEQAAYVLDKANKEMLNATEFGYVTEVIRHKGFEGLKGIGSLRSLGEAFAFHFFPLHDTNPYGDTRLDRSVYLAKLSAGTGKHALFSEYKEYYDAGIPVEAAIKAINNGGGLLQAQGIHQGGISEKLAEGWL